MTENLLEKLEEKMMALLTEVEDLRTKVQRLDGENSILKAEREIHADKLRGLISLIETVNPIETYASNGTIPLHKPMLVQGDKG